MNIVPQDEIEAKKKAFFEQILKYLQVHDIPPFTPFSVKNLSKYPLKWFSEFGKGKEGASHTVVCIQIETPTQGQNPDDPSATYRSWKDVHRRRVLKNETPKGLGLPPKKKRTASGSRHVTSTIKGEH